MNHRTSLRAALAFAILFAPLPALALSPPAVAANTNTATKAEDARLNAFFDKEYAEELKLSPQLASRIGMKEGRDKLDDDSYAGQQKKLDWRRDSVKRMKQQFQRSRLSPEGQVNFDIWAMELDRAELANTYRQFHPPFYSTLYSRHDRLPDFLINTHNVSEPADLAAYAARIRAIPGALDTAIAQMRDSAKIGVHTPKFQIERIIDSSNDLITGAPFDAKADSALWADAKAKTAKLVESGKISRAGADAALADIKAAMLGLMPAYQRVIAWAKDELPTAPSGRVGAVSVPGGADYYAAALKLNTTTDLTASQVHEIGLREVARIEGEQDALAREAGFKDRNAYYAERARLFPPQPWTDELRADYLKKANAAVAHTRRLLPGWFNSLPAYRMEVNREPSYSEVPGGAAHAAPPSPDGSRPGRVYVHLVGDTEDPAAMYTLMCHEAVPGHVTQGDIQVRQGDGPKFRKTTRYVAFSEGWALYAEALCKEMNAFPDVAADFHRLDAELFRAARLVVDTGIHANGWTEDQAVQYMMETGRQSADKARAEIRRYITLPGQATGYKIGMLKIMEMREKAEKALGDKFDLKGFHDLLIASGAQPMSILERRVDDWIAAKKRA